MEQQKVSLKNGSLVFEPAHICQICQNQNENVNVNGFEIFEDFINHLHSHNITFAEYSENFAYFYHEEENITGNIFYATLSLRIPKKNNSSDNNNIDDNKYIKINGELVKRKNFAGVKTYERLKMTVKKTKDGKKIVVGGLTDEDFSYIPEISDFEFCESFHKKLLMVASSPGFKTILLSGDMGTGKSQAVLQTAAIMKQPIIRIALTGDTRVKDIFQSENFDEKKKRIVYEDKAIIKAMKNGYWLLVDEFSAGNPTVMFIFFQLMEDGSVTTLDGQKIKAHPNFKLFLTDNRIGNPNFYRYHGTFQQNAALINRINTVILFKDLRSSAEMKILKRFNLPKKVVENLLEFCKVLRKEYDMGNYKDMFPIRSLINVCENYLIFGNMIDAIEVGYTNALTDVDDKRFANDLAKRYFSINSSDEEDFIIK